MSGSIRELIVWEELEALGLGRLGLPRQLSIVTKIALLREGRYFLGSVSPLAPPGLKRKET
jgi:hypothetical protein